MQFIVKIKTDGAAFGNGEFENPFGDSTNMEVGRILHELADRVDGMGVDATSRDQGDPFVLFDANGAQVGTAHFEEVD